MCLFSSRLFWDEGITDLGRIQFPLSAQAVPAFLFGLFSFNKRTDIHPWCISTGALAATIYVFTIYFGYFKTHENPIPINAGITGFCLQLAVTFLLESLRRIAGIKGETDKGDEGSETRLLFPDRPAWDIPALGRFGDHTLTPQLLWKSMEGINEPLANPWWAFLMFFTISICTPLTSELEPPLNTSDSDNKFFYPPAIYNGLPWWAFKIIMLCIVPTVLLLAGIYKMPDKFPINEKKIEKDGIEPDLVEMTREEMGRRASYDEQNILIHRRRSSISQTMEELGLTRSELMEANSSPSQRKLAALVMKSSRALDISEALDKVKEVDEHASDVEEVHEEEITA
jgi:hypothetical protein